MKSAALGKPLLLTFAAALAVYALTYTWIEHRRTRQGPWEVSFEVQTGTPSVVIVQPSLGIQNVRLVFAGQKFATNYAERVSFSQARPVPFDVPFGRCVFLDPLFLPGTVVLELFGHEIQLMARVLTLDKAEHPWRSGETITLQHAL